MRDGGGREGGRERGRWEGERGGDGGERERGGKRENLFLLTT